MIHTRANARFFLYCSIAISQMNFDINNLVRTVVIGGAALVVGIPLANLSNQTSKLVSATATGVELAAKPDKSDEAWNKLKAELTLPCIKFLLSKEDTKLERESKTQIEGILGGDVDFITTCKAVVD